MKDTRVIDDESSSFCGHCCLKIIQGKTLIDQISSVQEKLDILQFQILNRLLNLATPKNVKLYKNNEQQKNRNDIVVFVKKSLKLEEKQDSEEAKDNQNLSTESQTNTIQQTQNYGIILINLFVYISLIYLCFIICRNR